MILVTYYQIFSTWALNPQRALAETRVDKNYILEMSSRGCQILGCTESIKGSVVTTFE